MMIQENSNKLYPSMVGQDQTILDYLIRNQQIIHPFDIDTNWFLKLLKWLLLLKRLIYGNNPLKVYKNMSQWGNLVDMTFCANL